MPQLQGRVQAPPSRPPRYGLLVAVPPVSDEDLHVLAAGWTFQPEGCDISGIDTPDCAGNVGVMALDAQPSTITGSPLWVYSGDECSAFGYLAREWQGRARRRLAATESYEIALELWAGAVQQSESLNNKYLASPGGDSDTVTDGPSSILNAMANLEAALADTLRGQQGLMHMTPQLLTHAVASDLVRRDGNVWVSPMGHIVVADAGYTGSGPGDDPSDAGLWIYGTPMLQIRLGPVEVIPGDLDNAVALAASMDRDLNDIVVFAGRLAAVQWSVECAHIAAQTNIPLARIGGTS